jgi:23S rRNA (cytidine2498-2'-O)-methyltransferase
VTFPKRKKTEKKATKSSAKKGAASSREKPARRAAKAAGAPDAEPRRGAGERAGRRASGEGKRRTQGGRSDRTASAYKLAGRKVSATGTERYANASGFNNRNSARGKPVRGERSPKAAHFDVRKTERIARGEGTTGARAGGTVRAERPSATKGKFAARGAERPAARGKFTPSSGERAVKGKFAPRAGSRPAAEGKFAPRQGGRATSERKFTPSAGERPAPKGKFAPRTGERKTDSKFTPRGDRNSKVAARSSERPAAARKFAPRAGTRPGASAALAARGEPSTGSGGRLLSRKGARGVAAAEKFDGRKSRTGSSGDAPRSSALKPRLRFAARREVDPNERVFVPQTPTPSPLRRTTKPLERKRPDLSDEPHPGHFLITTREGSEQDVVDELMLAGVVDPPPRVLAPALVLAPKVPRNDKRPIELAFARQGFPIIQSVHAHDLEEISQRISRSLRGQLEKADEYGLHVWVPDSDLGNPLAAMATELESKIVAQLELSLPNAKRVDDGQLRRMGSMLFAQVCLIDPERAVAGVTYSNAALSLARGGRTRVRVTGHFPSRAARKLEEALAWLGVAPGPGELCVDLGAAPGGWTYVLADRRARVIAVDPAKLKPEILEMKGVRHVQESAFNYKPDAEVDWLFCDMAWRPLEAAALLAKWGRNRWTRMMVANIKLPMTKKAEIVARVRHILATEGDWKHIRVKQLYHDRDEVTLSAHVS